MIKTLSKSVLIALLLLNSTVVIADKAILVGGGYNINGSQGQIELNVKWVQQVLQNANIPVTAFFTDGDDPTPDVHYLTENDSNNEPTPLDELANELQPVSRLFGDHIANAVRYRNHSVANVAGSTRAPELTQSISDLFSQANDDATLIVYNGHGKQSPANADQVTLELWDNTQMTAAELHSLIEPATSPTRFVFTQCYSGGFHRLAYKNPAKGLELSESLRCGFTSESAYRLAEGCSASINSNDYRDYTTYFFAALDGYDRHGEILGVDTDANGDGKVTLREAHLYTLEAAHSTDLSRSTSEDYLINWQPWFLKWIAGNTAIPDNEYAKLFRSIAAKYNIDLSNNSSKEIRKRMAEYKEVALQLTAQREQLHEELSELQFDLAEKATRKWPQLIGPYTAAFQSMTASGEMLNVATWVADQPDYPRIEQLQQQDDSLVADYLENERNLTQMQKMIHMRRLADLKRQLYQFGNADEVGAYERLLSCEDAPLNFSSQ